MGRVKYPCPPYYLDVPALDLIRVGLAGVLLRLIDDGIADKPGDHAAERLGQPINRAEESKSGVGNTFGHHQLVGGSVSADVSAAPASRSGGIFFSVAELRNGIVEDDADDVGNGVDFTGIEFDLNSHDNFLLFNVLCGTNILRDYCGSSLIHGYSIQPFHTSFTDL